MKRAIIVHGWDGFPENHWFPWLQKKLEEKDFHVVVPRMPDPENPKMETWVPFLKRVIGKPDQETFLVGHSIGCQTIVRYLEQLPSEIKIGGVLLVGGWVNLTPKATADEESKNIAQPWLKKIIDWKRVKSHSDRFTAIFSDNDPFVSVGDAQIFKEKLNAKTIIVKGKEHFTKRGSLSDIPEVLGFFDTA
ncbi:serine hydrolase family protein [Candidatus Woesearchaeota archaeon]|nr:serine hydrolase family protein [Candidatus Woesearchaeota archaeon]